jgi:2-polyprenyl-3-methyl-5-hydroxy-6-metoxy-1,4-benzoquinol methylase
LWRNSFESASFLPRNRISFAAADKSHNAGRTMISQTSDQHARDVAQHARFEFGENWAQFLESLDEDRIEQAMQSLQRLLGVSRLDGKTFLDAGSGSGLSSLVARRMGARVHSFDYDPQSVACTQELARRPDDGNWVAERGSVLDPDYMGRLPAFDIVYSWGVLHHTGAMWVGLEHCVSKVAPGGHLFIAIYNDQGWKSHLWWGVKFVYNRLPRGLNKLYAYSLGYLANAVNILKYTLKLRPMAAIRPLLQYRQRRGMSVHRDMIDWMGGFPYEFATWETLEAYLHARGFDLVNGVRATSLGCHEMVFRRSAQ